MSAPTALPVAPPASLPPTASPAATPAAPVTPHATPVTPVVALHATTSPAAPASIDPPAAPSAAPAAPRELAPTVEEAYRLYHKRIYGLCLRWLRSPADAEDAAQDVFLHLHRKIHLFRGEAKFSTWLHRLAVNLLLMRLRRGGAGRAGVSLESLLATALEDDVAPAEYQRAVAVDDPALRGAVAARWRRRVMARMPTGYRIALTLAELEGFSMEEVAELTGTSVSNAKSQLYKARRWLEAALGCPRSSASDDNLDTAFAALRGYASDDAPT